MVENNPGKPQAGPPAKEISSSASEIKYRTLVEASPDAIILADAETGFCLDCNKAAERLLGRTREEIIGLHQTKIHHPQNSGHYAGLFKKHAEMASGVVENISVLHKKGRLIPVDIKTVILELEGKKVIYGIFRDVTDRIEAEKAKKTIHQSLLTVLDGLEAVVYVADIKTYEVLFINRYARDVIGDIIGGTCWKTIQVGQTGPCAFCTNNKILDDAGNPTGVYAWEFQNTKNGRWYSIRDRAIEWIDGRLVRLEIALDITESKWAEMELREAQELLLRGKEELEARVKLKTEERIEAYHKAENATRFKNNFISLVAHDLKSPLASLSMGLDALAAAKDLPPESRDFAKKMANHSRQLHKITDRLLDISLLQAGVMILQKRVINCHNFVASQIELYGAMAAQKGITIVNSLPENMKAHADPDLFGECVKNVLSNAIKFCGQGDTATFFNPPDMPATIAVKDTGPGISPEKLPPLLTKGMKTRTVGSAGEKGTGIGLIHTKEILEAHGGNITFESEAGGGSTFYLNLPAFDNVVLVVDDDEASTLVLRLHLMNMGAEVLTAQNGVEALEIIQGRLPILIITDIQMPMMDGFTLLRNLKANLRYSQIPVIIITGSNEMDARKKAFANKAVDFIIKPLSEPDFIPRIGRFIAG